MEQAVKDPVFEWKLCVFALPAMLGLAILFDASGAGSFFQRTFFGMPVHELGHAVTAWFCGFNAIPSLWITSVPDERGLFVPVCLLMALGYGGYRAWYENRIILALFCGLLIVLQLAGSLAIPRHTARLLITFGGDGMGMIIAVMLMTLFFFGKNTQLYKGALRWGFLVIGAAAFIDIYTVWWDAQDSIEAVPYGTTGSTPTDVYKLVQWHGWDFQTIISRYFRLGNLCILFLVLSYLRGIHRAYKHMKLYQRVERIKRNRDLAKSQLGQSSKD